MTSRQIIDRFGLRQIPETAPAELAKFKNQKTFATDPAGNLIGLNLCGCGLRDADFLQSPDFQHLQALNLSENPDLTAVKIPLAMRHLQHLNVSENENLISLTFGAALPALETLLADQCKIASIVFPGGFAALTKVDFRKNELASVVFEAGCPALAFLDFSQNRLVELRLPGKFPGLKYLYLNDNPELKSLLFDNPAEALEILHLRGGKLEHLPDNLLKFKKLKTLYLHGNPLPNVPKGASGVPEGERDNAWDNLRNYLRSIEKPEDTLPNDEVKLVLLGNSTAGKSSFLRFLRKGEYDEKTLGSTHGIENLLWEPSELPFKVNVWDFGGQEFYHATHRLFLSENAVSLVVFEQKTNYQGETGLLIRFYKNGKVQAPNEMPVEIFPFDYWLDNINYFCKKKQRTALLQTKMDEPDARKIALKTAQEEKYPLIGYQQISVKAAHAGEEKHLRKFRDFRDDLFAWLEDARGNYPFNRYWLEIKNDIRQ